MANGINKEATFRLYTATPRSSSTQQCRKSNLSLNPYFFFGCDTNSNRGSDDMVLMAGVQQSGRLKCWVTGSHGNSFSSCNKKPRPPQRPRRSNTTKEETVPYDFGVCKLSTFCTTVGTVTRSLNKIAQRAHNPTFMLWLHDTMRPSFTQTKSSMGGNIPST